MGERLEVGGGLCSLWDEIQDPDRSSAPAPRPADRHLQLAEDALTRGRWWAGCGTSCPHPSQFCGDPALGLEIILSGLRTLRTN